MTRVDSHPRRNAVAANAVPTVKNTSDVKAPSTLRVFSNLSYQIPTLPAHGVTGG